MAMAAISRASKDNLRAVRLKGQVEAYAADEFFCSLLNFDNKLNTNVGAESLLSH